MSTQIAVRLPDEMVAFLDSEVAHGEAKSRAELVGVALEREMRRRAALRDVEILAEKGVADELDTVVMWTATRIDIED